MYRSAVYICFICQDQLIFSELILYIISRSFELLVIYIGDIYSPAIYNNKACSCLASIAVARGAGRARFILYMLGEITYS